MKKEFHYSKYQQGRLILSRLFSGTVILLFAFTRNHWETKAEILTAALFLAGCILVAVATLGRLWCTLYIAGYKTRVLIEEGPYSLCRHPLYFFSFLGALGVGLATETLTIPLILAVIFAAYYPFVIRFEEKKMIAEHGRQYEDYRRQTPCFLPRWPLLKEPEEYLVHPCIFRRHLFQSLLFVWLVGILECLECLKEMGWLPSLGVLY
ncbi:MAG TPA: isoprenylcysteine carboxylmethyltransferase family protein [Anaerohalosphaeraceae bacterium]|nr:isoprenylcysteine carboxylmethyltransferase family protein [Anaerohalosphaeraceae bacterium]HPB92791.1 isoprenylcysteine carboxylmethyltransferase family protein [Anaerohalosphaeraceae bacterium]HRT22826.1 isoprenylcysteine carboxylmethyltransferase family protein [Anaerohalosphaeraceae bacterium]HRU14761.1 isoprenylcysteine carboxylmethyltransferase family protein [Anaerohalosphaeraceae bacterium]